MRLLVAIICAIVLISSFVDSYAYNPKYDIGINVQIKIENSDGALVSYLETYKARIFDLAKLNSFLDQDNPVLHKKIITIGDQKYELIKTSGIVIHGNETIVSANLVSVKNNNLLQVLALTYHDGYPVQKGDKVTTYWTILRAVS